MSGSSGQHASRSRNTPTSPGASTRGARSPIRAVADPVGARPPNNIFGALAEDEAGDGAEDPGPQFSALISASLGGETYRVSLSAISISRCRAGE